MARNWIPEGVDADVVGAQADIALTEVEQMAKRGYVASGVLENASRSYLYTDDDGNLKFYNKNTGATGNVTIT